MKAYEAVGPTRPLWNQAGDSCCQRSAEGTSKLKVSSRLLPLHHVAFAAVTAVPKTRFRV